MLEDLLRKAVEIGADRVEVEYKDGTELVTAFRGPVGIGISSIDSTHRGLLCREMQDLKKRRKATLGCNTYGLTFSKYESFGEWVHVIEIHGARKRPNGCSGLGKLRAADPLCQGSCRV